MSEQIHSDGSDREEKDIVPAETLQPVESEVERRLLPLQLGVPQSHGLVRRAKIAEKEIKSVHRYDDVICSDQPTAAAKDIPSPSSPTGPVTCCLIITDAGDSDRDPDACVSTTCGHLLTFLSWILIIVTMPWSLCMCLRVINEYERAVIFRLGRLLSGVAAGPGLFFIVPCTDQYTKVDLRTVTFDVPPQELLSKDSVSVSVDAVVYYRIANATSSITNIEDVHYSTHLLAQTTLRNVLGTKNLSEMLSDRENISHLMQTTLDEATAMWGVKVERVEIKDVRLPKMLQRAMAAEAEAQREAKAKEIVADGEREAASLLRSASEVINSSSSALQLRYLQTLSQIACDNNSTIIFPMPLDFFDTFSTINNL